MRTRTSATAPRIAPASRSQSVVEREEINMRELTAGGQLLCLENALAKIWTSISSGNRPGQEAHDMIEIPRHHSPFSFPHCLTISMKVNCFESNTS